MAPMEWIRTYLFQLSVTSTVGGIIAYLKRLYRRDKEEKAQTKVRMDAMEGGVRALLRDRLISAIHKAKKQGFIYVHELENIDKMYKEYINLGGNGTIIHMMKEVSQLPTKTDIN